MVTVGKLGPRGDVSVVEAHNGALRYRIVPSVHDAGRRLDRCLHDGRVEETFRFFLLHTHHVSEYLVLEPLEQRCLIEIGVERGIVGFPPVRCTLDLTAPVAAALKPVDAVPREQRPAVAWHSEAVPEPHKSVGPESWSYRTRDELSLTT